MAKILIIGGSVGIGLETLKMALDAGHEVRALARRAGRISIEHPKLTKIAADARDAAQMRKAVEGVDLVINSIGYNIITDDPGGVPHEIAVNLGLAKGEPITLFQDTTPVLLDAMKAAGVKRTVMVSGIAGGNSRGKIAWWYDGIVYPLVFKRVYENKTIGEEMVQASGLDWVIIRPGALHDGPLTKKYRVLNDPKDWRFGAISRKDVADFLIRLIDDRSYDGKTPLLIK